MYREEEKRDRRMTDSVIGHYVGDMYGTTHPVNIARSPRLIVADVPSKPSVKSRFPNAIGNLRIHWHGCQRSDF